MTPDDPLLIKELRRDEGVRYDPYLDTMNFLTVGVGHNIQAKAIPLDWEYPLTDDQVDQLLAEDLQDVFNNLDRTLPWWRKLSYVRQRVLANMCFNMGLHGLLTFKNTLANMQCGNYFAAAEGMRKSKWARQVKGRATRLAAMMEQG